uniref:MAGE domain-containing protein n=4 Tax=Clytia hemisphaerica TaxID=252671 RepID=A0A7M5XEN9_9CNID
CQNGGKVVTIFSKAHASSFHHETFPNPDITFKHSYKAIKIKNHKRYTATMPRKKVPQEGILDMSEAGPSSQSQSIPKSQSQPKKRISNASEKVNVNNPDFKRKVSEMVRYLLFADRKKNGIKRADIIKNVLKENPKWFAKVFEEASLKINQVFGLDVVSLETEKKDKSKGYTLISALDDDIIQSDSTVVSWGEESQEMALLLIILSLIFMNDGPLTEASLWFTLKKIGVYKERKHRVFGDVNKLVNNDFIKVFYLTRHKEISADGPSFTYSIGPRAAKEISKRKILTFVSQVYGYDDIKKWKNQYEIVEEEETHANQSQMDVDSD